MSFCQITLPGEIAVFLPTSKASTSVCRIRSLPLPRSRSCEHHLEAAHQVLALLVRGRLEHLGVQREEVRRVQRLDIVAGVERDLLALLGVHLADIVDGVLDVACGEQVVLLEVLEERVLRPVLVGEALVGLHHVRQIERLALVLGAEPLQHRLLPQRLLRRPVVDRHVGDLPRDCPTSRG
jgi:hypothetical protein